MVDCGKDCPVESLVDTVEREGALALGISGLITSVIPQVRHPGEEMTVRGLEHIRITAGGAALKQASAASLNVDFVDDGKTPCAECPAEKVIKYGEPTQAIRYLPNGRGWDLKTEPVLDDNGKTAGIVELVDDITDKLRLETALRQSEKMEGNTDPWTCNYRIF